MQVAQIKPSSRPRTRRPRARYVHAPVRRPAARPVEPRVEAVDRARRAGGPEDRALYVCHCGVAFEADVSASVACPTCGDFQSW